MNIDYKKFGELDERFKGTSLEDKEFWTWAEKDYTEEFSEKKENCLKLIKIYDKYKDECNLSYPAFYIKGKNGPYYNSICMEVDYNDNSDYSHYRGIYVDISGYGGCTFYVDGDDINMRDGGTLYDYIMGKLTESEKELLREVGFIESE